VALCWAKIVERAGNFCFRINQSVAFISRHNRGRDVNDRYLKSKSSEQRVGADAPHHENYLPADPAASAHGDLTPRVRKLLRTLGGVKTKLLLEAGKNEGCTKECAPNLLMF
jgi:hypothetical protein